MSYRVTIEELESGQETSYEVENLVVLLGATRVLNPPNPTSLIPRPGDTRPLPLIQRFRVVKPRAEILDAPQGGTRISEAPLAAQFDGTLESAFPGWLHVVNPLVGWIRAEEVEIVVEEAQT